MDNLTESTILLDEPVIEDPAAVTDTTAAPTQEPLPSPEETGDISANTDGDAAPAEDAPIDYEALASRDLDELRRLVPALRISHIGDLPGATRYAELRDRGLSAEEAFWASCHGIVPGTAPGAYDNRSHLHSAVPRGAAGNPAVMSAAEMRAAKDLFDDLSESEIQKLYTKCRS